MPARDRVLIPGALRVPAAVAAALAATVVLVLGMRYSGDSGPSRVDGHLDRAVDALPSSGHGLARLLTVFGSPAFVAVAALGIATGCLVSRRPRSALLAVAGPGLTGLVTTVGKPLVDRTIGYGGLAFPSGHTGGATAGALVLALLAAAALELGPGATAALALACAVLAGGVVGGGMVVAGSHYPTDVVGGFCVALAAVLAVALALDAVSARGRRRAGPAGSGRPGRPTGPSAAGSSAGRPSR